LPLFTSGTTCSEGQIRPSTKLVRLGQNAAVSEYQSDS
jgi:hypothetical protein